MKLLIVEDEPSLRELMQRALLQERYIIEVAEDYNEAMTKLSLYDYDVVLLDLMLPDGNGLDLLRYLKDNNKESSVLILSAKDSTDDKVKGLELGADDYLAKPFHLSELKARINSVSRRRLPIQSNCLTYGNVELNLQTYDVTCDSKPLDIGRKEYDILSFFLSHPNRLLSKEFLAESVWGDHFDQVDNYDFIYAQIKNIRRKLKEAGADIEIKSVYGFGYKLSDVQ